MLWPSGDIGPSARRFRKGKAFVEWWNGISFVTTKEKRKVYEALATQFSGTGTLVLLHKQSACNFPLIPASAFSQLQ